jgi:orotate phosphoribosyltransferase
MMSDLGRSQACLAEEEIMGLAGQGTALASHPQGDHVVGCTRCASLFASYRSVRVVEALPARWHVRLQGITFNEAEEGEKRFQALGRVLLEKLQFELCEDGEAWQATPLCVRVNLVLDPVVDHFSLTLLEVPDRFEAVSVKTSKGWEALESMAPDGTFEFWKVLSEYYLKDRDTYPLASLLDYIEAGLLEIVFASHQSLEQHKEDSDDEAFLLSSFGAVERECDYELPSGLHTDTHINTGRLCRSENALRAVASSFNALFRDIPFDTIVTNGWAMSTIARRLAAIRSAHTDSDPIAEIMYEGYDPALAVEDISFGSRVLILADVVITGKLMRRLQNAVQAAGGKVVACGCLVDAHYCATERPASFRALFRLPMDLSEPGNCLRCGRLEARVFNPFAGCMTARASEARSPSEFLAEHHDVLEFWERVDLAGAYQHHKVEGKAHYTAFVDTAKLLEHAEIGPQLVEKLRDLLGENQVVPGAIVAPNRKRAKLLATALKSSFEMASGGPGIPLFFGSLRAGRWQLPDGEETKLADTDVLLVDSAAGHGKTIDLLSMLARRAGARRVAAAVLLSRLTESCAAAFQSRFSGGFYSLYRLPVRPVVIRGTSKELCPVCQRRAAVHNAAVESRLEAIERWDAWLSRIRRLPTAGCEGGPTRAPAEEASLFSDPEPSFFETCSRAVASGVVLHSLYAAKTNGMAPLALPEITNEAIPASVRAAILEHLPPGVIAWSRGALERDLERCLATVKNSGLWRASAEVLAQERHARWLDYLDAFLSRAARYKTPPTHIFWNALACNVYLVSRRSVELKYSIRQRLERLHQQYVGSELVRGLSQMLEAIDG